MKAKNCLIFGGTGQIGRNLIRKIAKNNFRITIVTRNLHQKGNFIKTQANAGYIDIVELNPFNEQDLTPYFKKADICINLIGILFEKNKNNFNNIHINLPQMIAKLCKKFNVGQLIHLSALGLLEAKDSKYASSKLEGENQIREIFPSATILKPSVVFSVDDNFTTSFMTLLNQLPIFPLYYNGETKFMPIHCSDLTDVIFKVLTDEIKSETIECGGPDIISFKEILKTLINLIEKKRFLIPMPLFAGKIVASVMELMPKPLLTNDQLKLLKYDNIYSGKFKTNKDIGVPSKKIFADEVKKYCYMWREGGEYTKEKYKD